MEARFITVKMAEELFGFDKRAIYKMIKAQEIPAAPLGGKWLIDRVELEKRLTELSQTPKAGMKLR